MKIPRFMFFPVSAMRPSPGFQTNRQMYVNIRDGDVTSWSNVVNNQPYRCAMHPNDRQALIFPYASHLEFSLLVIPQRATISRSATRSG
jgi:hypothetical protein